MTPTALAAHERHARFHAEIARRSSMVPQREDRTYFIPNTPFGVKKLHTMLPRPKPAPNPELEWWHCMWFFDLVQQRSIPALGFPLQCKDIQRAVSRKFGISMTDLLADRRHKKFVRARHIAIYLAKTMTERSLPEIGRRFNGRDHTTILHAVRKIEKLLERDPALVQLVAELRTELRR